MRLSSSHPARRRVTCRHIKLCDDRLIRSTPAEVASTSRFVGISSWVALSRASEDKSPLACHLRSFREGLRVLTRRYSGSRSSRRNLPAVSARPSNADKPLRENVLLMRNRADELPSNVADKLRTLHKHESCFTLHLCAPARGRFCA